MEPIVFNIIVQGLGGIGILASILSFQFRSHRTTMFFRTLNEVFFGLQYMLLGAYTGAAMNFIGSVRNVLFAELVRKKKSTALAQCLFSVAFAVFIMLTWGGAQSLLSGIAKIASTILYGNSNTKVIRIGVLFTSSLWLLYNLYVGSIAGVVCEIITLLSIVVGLIRLDKKVAKKQKQYDVD